ncbi:AsmA family protein [Spongiibacter nanhainus]|uniref:AsmA family protein n=1 Tax=Spongiibacter nanhainus TaxID=2794344 RepID=A0A7T4UQM9_9GAMM|nr:AsmA family protein [Spongiibacter nanhainus]QQD18861.1 AsmA family protein [Spongiibacter nanhainus]
MLKKLAFALLLILLLIIAAITTVLIKPDLLTGLIRDGGQRFAGLDITFTGLRSARKPLRLEIEGLRIANPSWPEPELLTLSQATIALQNMPFGQDPFWSLDAKGLNVTVASNDAGELNWISPTLSQAAEQEEEEPEADDDGPILPKDFNFDHVRIEDVTITWQAANNEPMVLKFPEIAGQRLQTASGELTLLLDYRQQRFALSGGIELFDPQQGILDYRLKLDHDKAKVESGGRLVLSPNLSGSEMSISLSAQDIPHLAALADIELAPLPAVTLSADIAIRPAYHISELVVTLDGQRIEGELQLDPAFEDIKAQLKANTLDIDALFPATEEDDVGLDNKGDAGGNAKAENGDKQLANAGTANGAASKDQQEAPIDWSWMQDRKIALDLNIGELDARGWQIKAAKLQATVDKRVDAKLKADEINEVATERQLTALDADVTFTPLSLDKPTQGTDAELTLNATSTALNLSAEGKVNVNGLAGTAVNVAAKAAQSQPVWALALQPWKEAGALDVDLDLTIEEQQYDVDATLGLGEQRSELVLTYHPGDIAKLNGELSASKLDLAFMRNLQSGPSDDEKPEPAANKSGRIFSDDTLPLDSLKSINAQLSINLKDIDTGYVHIENATLAPQLEDGKFQLDDGRLKFVHGEALASLLFDSSLETPALELDLKVDSEDYGEMGLEKLAGITGGKGKIRIELNSEGNSQRQLAANLDGQIDMKVKDLVAKGNALNLIGSDILSETIDKLNPFTKKRTQTDIECVAVHFKGKNGNFITDDGLALETDTTKIIGTGKVDLAQEELSLGVSPIARKGVGINVGAAAGLVRLGGTLSKPKVVADPGGMVTGSLSTGAAIYTGGLSLLAQGLYKRAMYSGSACDGELDAIPSVEALPDELINPPQPSEDGGTPENGTAPGSPASGAGTDSTP